MRSDEVATAVAPVAGAPTLLERIAASAGPAARLRVLGRRGGEQALSHADLVDLARRSAGGLLAAGVREGDIVGLVLRADIHSIASLLGVWMAGGAVALVPPPGQLEPRGPWWERSEALLARAGAELLILESRRAPSGLSVLQPSVLVEHHPTSIRAPHPDDPAVVTTTSGTTERPRLLQRTQGSLVAQLEAHVATKGGTDPEADHRLGWGPLHRRALGGDLLYPLALGVESTLLPTMAFAARPLRWLEELSRYRATFSTAPASAYRRVARLLEQAAQVPRLDLSAWRHAHLAGERVDADVLERFAAAAAPYGFDPSALCVSYGSRELGNITGNPAGSGVHIDRIEGQALADGRAVPAATDPPNSGPVKVVSVGRPNGIVQLRLLDEAGRDVAERVVGEVVVRGPSLSSGYLDDDTGDERFLDGWFHTRDLGYRANGNLFLVGRRDDVIIVGGVNVHAGTLEQAIRRSVPQEVDGIAVFPVSEDGLERLVVAVESPAPAHEVRRELLRGLSTSGERVPDAVVVVAPGSLPRTEEGKIRRRAAADAYLAGLLVAMSPSG